MPHAIKVLIAHDDAIVAELVNRALKDQYRMLAPVTELEALEPALATHSPDIVLLGLIWRDVFLLPQLRQLRERYLATRFCIYSPIVSPSIVRDAIQAGASGYLVVPATRSDLVGAIECAHGAPAYLSQILHPIRLFIPNTADDFLIPAVPPLLGVAPDSIAYSLVIAWLVYDLRLTPRQAEVALAIRDGVPEKRIALRIGCSTATVRKHVRAVYSRLSEIGVGNHGSLGALVERSLGHRPLQWRPVI